MNRVEFMGPLYGLLTSSDAKRVELAYLLAKKIHRGQVRKELDGDGQPLRYFEHLRRTALIVVNEGGVDDTDTIIAALLHDAIEDSEEIQLVSLMIQELFGSVVARTVQGVSKVPKAGYLDRFKNSIVDTVGRSAVVKAADRLDNLRSLPADNPEFCEKQRRETREIILPILDLAEPQIHQLLLPGFRIILGKIKELV
jgi:(p)ppGpp synthase/HD superfamily hydrolase